MPPLSGYNREAGTAGRLPARGRRAADHIGNADPRYQMNDIIGRRDSD